MAGKLITDYIQSESGSLVIQNVTGSTIFSANASGFYTGSGSLVIGTGGTANSSVSNVTANTGNITSISANTVFANTVNSVSISARTGYGLVGTLTSNTTITPDFAQYNNWTLTLGTSATLANATNTTVGQSGVIYITQDTTGSRTLAYGSMWKFLNATAPTLSTAANSVDILVYTVQSSTRIDANLLTNFN